MSQAGANSSSGSGGSAIITIDGDIGSVTGSTVTITGGTTGYTFNGSGSVLTLEGSGTGFTWITIVSSQPLVAAHGYFVALGALSLSLPATSSVGDTISVSLLNTGTSWTITQGAGQSIRVGNVSSTLGTGGSVSSTMVGDTLTLVSYANGMWQATSSMGELQII